MAKNQFGKSESLATELIKEVKAQSKRWFIAFLIVLGLWFGTVAGFIWYLSLPVDEVTIENEDGNANYIGNDLKGDLINGKDN